MGQSQVLFLCTGNSCRSQMAEGLVNHFLSDTWEAFSAGTKPSGYVHPMAIQAMAELGIDISAHRSKSTDEYRDVAFDRVITVCDHAAQNCPAWLGKGIVKHIGFSDPADAEGSDEERMAVFRQVRDGLREKVFEYLQSEEPTTPEFHLNAGTRRQKRVWAGNGRPGNKTNYLLRASWARRHDPQIAPIGCLTMTDGFKVLTRVVDPGSTYCVYPS